MLDDLTTLDDESIDVLPNCGESEDAGAINAALSDYGLEDAQ